MYSVVDIETTGGVKNGNKITEIAIINFDGEKIVDSFTTLIDPERNIPPAITRLTGIKDEMMVDAPKFYEVAKKIVEMTEGNIFVAHNVFFDFNFIKSEFNDLGYSFNREKLCTVRMARKFLPGHKSYSLGNICRDLGIPIKARHRAMGDAEATVELLKRILKKDKVEEFKLKESKSISLPKNLDRNVYDALPNKHGVYYFYNEEGQIIYVGKSVDIKKRISSHFRPDIKRKKDLELKNSISDIKYKLLGNELASLLYEAHEIKSISPKFNRSLRKRRYPVAVELKENKDGELHLKMTHKNLNEDYLFTFASKKTAQSKINKIYKSIVGFEGDSIHFENAKSKYIKAIGLDQFNELLRKACFKNFYHKEDFEVVLPGKNRRERCIIEVRNKYPKSIQFIKSDETVGEYLELFHHQDLKNILHGYVLKHDVEIIPLEDYDKH